MAEIQVAPSFGGIRPLQEFLEFFRSEIQVLKADYGCRVLVLNQVDEEFASLAAVHGIIDALDQVIGRCQAILAVVGRLDSQASAPGPETGANSD
jgi:hypothetical protein